jgi:hypothetical protein
MTHKDILAMAAEAGWLGPYESPTGFSAEAAISFAALIAAHEREKCAKVCEEAARLFTNSGHIGVCIANAGAIRARK